MAQNKQQQQKKWRNLWKIRLEKKVGEILYSKRCLRFSSLENLLCYLRVPLSFLPPSIVMMKSKEKFDTIKSLWPHLLLFQLTFSWPPSKYTYSKITFTVNVVPWLDHTGLFCVNIFVMILIKSHSHSTLPRSIQKSKAMEYI